MAGVNKVILVGHLGKDPEMKYGQQSNVPVCRFSLATSEKFKGEERTEWHNIVCFNKTAEIASQYLRKGRLVYVEGRIQTRKWQDKDGNDRYTTEILANNLTMLGGRRDDAGYGDEGYSAPRPKARPAEDYGAYEGGEAPAPGKKPAPEMADDPFSGGYGPAPSEDDMPF